MAPKPFGKPTPRFRRIPGFTRAALLLWAASPVAYFALSSGSRSYRTLAADAFFWPSAIVFGIILAAAAHKWMRSRPTPRAPDEGYSWGYRAVRVLLPLVLAAPFAVACAFLYQPGLKIVNGALTTASLRTTHAFVESRKPEPLLRSPYWPPEFKVNVGEDVIPPDAATGSLARLTLSRGFLGALWIRSIEIEEFR
jgi:hypothetical protein